jgi:hypothetical protein
MNAASCMDDDGVQDNVDWEEEAADHEEEEAEFAAHNLARQNSVNEEVNYRQQAAKQAANSSNNQDLETQQNSLQSQLELLIADENNREEVILSENSSVTDQSETNQNNKDNSNNNSVAKGDELTISFDVKHSKLIENSANSPEKGKVKKKTSQPKPKLTQPQKSVLSCVERGTLVCRSWLLRVKHSIMESELLSGLIYSMLLPHNDLLPIAKLPSLNKNGRKSSVSQLESRLEVFTLDYLTKLTNWIHNAFEINLNQPHLSVRCATTLSNDSSSWTRYNQCAVDQLAAAIRSRKSDAEHLVLIYGALLKQLGIKVRLIQAQISLDNVIFETVLPDKQAKDKTNSSPAKLRTKQFFQPSSLQKCWCELEQTEQNMDSPIKVDQKRQSSRKRQKSKAVKSELASNSNPSNSNSNISNNHLGPVKYRNNHATIASDSEDSSVILLEANSVAAVDNNDENLSAMRDEDFESPKKSKSKSSRKEGSNKTKSPNKKKSPSKRSINSNSKKKRKAQLESEESVEQSAAEDESECIVCRADDSAEGNPLLLCDYCTFGQHLKCVKPRIRSVPKGKFKCQQCRDKKAAEEEEEAGEEAEENTKKSSSKPHCTASSKKRKRDNDLIRVSQWLEVFCPSEYRWISLDPVNNLVDKPKLYETATDTRWLAVIGCYKGNFGYILHDVTPRYAAKWAVTSNKRKSLGEVYWNGVQLSFSAKLSQAEKQLYDEEEAELHSSHSEEMPTSLAAFKNHPKYVLEEQLKKFEVLHPRAPLGSVKLKGQAGETQVFSRSAVQLLHTKDRWIRAGRKLRRSEEGNPVKQVKAHHSKKKIKGIIVEENILADLYGIWQTDEFKPEAARDGKVPKNERGHVDLWDSSHLPPGCVHLPYPRIRPVANKLGVDCAEAMVGFEVHGGRSVPKFDGIIVCQEFAQIVLDAYWAREKELQQKEEEKQKEKMLFNWKSLIQFSIRRFKVMQQLKLAEQQQTENNININPSSSYNNLPSQQQQQQQQQGMSLDHVHSFDQAKTFESSTAEWIHTCSCGAVQRYQEF